MGMVLPCESLRRLRKYQLPCSECRIIHVCRIAHVDNFYLQGESYESCLKNVNDIIIMLRSLGFTIHSENAILKPTQSLICLGFIIHSEDMTLKLTEEKK